jgi:hypothetical protein
MHDTYTIDTYLYLGFSLLVLVGYLIWISWYYLGQ